MAYYPLTVTGPTSATDNALTRFDGTTGTIIQSSGITIDDSNNITGVGTLTGNVAGNASTVTTNANLTGPITSSGNATSIASQTGTGTKFVVDTSPTLVTPNIGAATGTSLNLGTGNLSTVGNLSLDGTAARDITMARATSGVGLGLTINGGGAQSGGTNLTGGNLTLIAPMGVGNGTGSRLLVQLSPPAGSGSTDQVTATSLIFLKTSATAGLGLQFVINNTITGSVNGITLNGNNAETIYLARHTTSNTAGVSLTVQSGGATSGATDKAAGALILGAGLSTGTGASAVKIQTNTTALSTGTSDNTATDRIIVTSPKSIANNTATTIFSLTNANSGMVAGLIDYVIEVTDGTDYQVEAGTIEYGVLNKAGAFTQAGVNGVTILGTALNKSTSISTLTVTWTATGANPTLVQLNANSSLTPSTGYPRVTCVLKNLTQQAVTVS